MTAPDMFTRDRLAWRILRHLELGGEATLHELKRLARRLYDLEPDELRGLVTELEGRKLVTTRETLFLSFRLMRDHCVYVKLSPVAWELFELMDRAGVRADLGAA